MRIVLGLLLLVGGISAQPKPPAVKDGPVLLLAVPTTLPHGEEKKIVLRGLHLETLTAIECLELGERKLKIVRKGNAPPANPLRPEKVGNTEVEVVFPAIQARELRLHAVNPAGRSPEFILRVDDPGVVWEKEPNMGFRQAQRVMLGQTIAGAIQSNQDVDCFAFTGAKNEQVVVEVLAERLGSPLDVVLTLSDGSGRILAQVDDLPESRDARLEYRLPAEGIYQVALQDAHDLGSPLHGYRLLLRRK